MSTSIWRENSGKRPEIGYLFIIIMFAYTITED